MSEEQPKIAIVDDEVDILELYELVLEAHFQTRTFSDPEVAVKAITESNDFDVILTDLSMPKLNGIDLIEALKKNFVDTPVIIATGHADKASAIAALKVGGFAIIEKPIDRMELFLITQKATALYHLRKHNAKLLSFFTELFSRIDSPAKLGTYLRDVKPYVEKLVKKQKELEKLKSVLEKAS